MLKHLRWLPILLRGVLPVLMAVAGLGAVLYGVSEHSAVVWEVHEEEATIRIPVDLPPMPPGFEAPPFGGPQPPPFPGEPQFITQKVIKTTHVPLHDFEPRLIREVTFGGVVLREDGKLWRTYTGRPPSLCPT